MTSAPVTGTTSSGGGSGSGSSRWCPTPEQVMLLEGMYRGGLKTPTATQIQQITARLSIYGKIQGKNVFYWFQNHKARDRQKLRKKLNAWYQLHRPNYHPLHQVVGNQDASSCRTNANNANLDFTSDQTCNFMSDCPLMTMMMMDYHGTTPYCTRVPPKTLQLFPVATATATATTTTTTVDIKGEDQSSTTNP
ncbi:hypothetical protein LXL04_000488 [Taraxacum kok-saghyz]